jgi:hypothetical protein
LTLRVGDGNAVRFGENGLEMFQIGWPDQDWTWFGSVKVKLKDVSFAFDSTFPDTILTIQGKAKVTLGEIEMEADLTNPNRLRIKNNSSRRSSSSTKSSKCRS